MSEGKRPGGLTALAVINFVFGGIGVLGILAWAVMFAFMGAIAEAGSESGDEGAQALAKLWEEVGLGVFYAIFALNVLSTILIIASGVGYLKQKRFLGRTLGNGYAVLSIAASLIMALVVSDPEVGGGFNLISILGLVYPGLTLLLLNTTFKEDLIR